MLVNVVDIVRESVLVVDNEYVVDRVEDTDLESVTVGDVEAGATGSVVPDRDANAVRTPAIDTRSSNMMRRTQTVTRR